MKNVFRVGIAVVALVAVFFVVILPRISHRGEYEEVKSTAAEAKAEPK